MGRFTSLFGSNSPEPKQNTEKLLTEVPEETSPELLTEVPEETSPELLTEVPEETSPELLTEVPMRARDDMGHFIADDPSTPENEAWVGGVSPSKRKRTRKKKTF